MAFLQVAFLLTLVVYTGQFPIGGNIYSIRYSTTISGANIAMMGSLSKTPEGPQANRDLGKMALFNETKTTVKTSIRSLKAAANKLNALSNTPTPTQSVKNQSLTEAGVHNDTKATVKMATIIITKTAATKPRTPEPDSEENRGLAKIVLLNGTKTTAIVSGTDSVKAARSMLSLGTTPTLKELIGNRGTAATALFKETKTTATSAYSKTTNNVGTISAKASLRPQVNPSRSVPLTNTSVKQYKIKTLNRTKAHTTVREKPFQHIAGKNAGGKTETTASNSLKSNGKVRGSSKTENTTTGFQNLSNRSNLIKTKINRYRNVHPCNSIHTSAMFFKVNSVNCRRWTKQELLHQMNCQGTFNHQFLAASIQEAMHFKDLETGKSVNFSRSYVMPRPVYGHRLKRSLNINPGETLVGQCHAQKTVTESGTLRICPVCTAITRQPLEPRRFPEYMNELLCDPQMQSPYLPGIDGFCVQKTFTLELLQFNGEWELNTELTLQAGYSVYTEKWESYTQTIRRHCACELLPSSPMAIYL